MFEGGFPTTRIHRDRTPCRAAFGPRGGGMAPAVGSLGPRATRGMLAGMALLVLLMPMNYRAGTETDHPHAFFQEVIDLVTGAPHEHGAEVGSGHAHAGASDGHGHDHSHEPAATVTATVSPFLAADIPLSAAVRAAAAPASSTAHPARTQTDRPSGMGETSTDRDRVVAAVSSLSPDLPGVTDLTPAAEKGSAILVLATALAGVQLAASRRREWSDATDRLTAIARPVEAPPPRIAPC
ncbi:MAG TPA: hypothetical protein VNP95_07820 [Thermomicrobiales bacterium]|nr:hypothetical protein [Thermomicrobiales bacterium]